MIITIREFKVGVPNEVHIGDPDTGLGGLYDHLTAAYQNAETPTFEIRSINADGTEGSVVSNGTGTLSYIATSNGRYKGSSNYAAAVVHGTKYYVVVLVTGKVRKRLMVQAKYDDA